MTAPLLAESAAAAVRLFAPFPGVRVLARDNAVGDCPLCPAPGPGLTFGRFRVRPSSVDDRFDLIKPTTCTHSKAHIVAALDWPADRFDLSEPREEDVHNAAAGAEREAQLAASARTPSAMGETAPMVRTLADILTNPEAIAPPPVLIPRFAYRGRFTVYSALDKAGKSTVMTAAIAAYTAGRQFLGEPCGPGTALWLLLEEHVGDFARRAVRFDADPARVHVMDYTTNAEADLREAMAQLRPDVVVVDTLIRYAGERVRDSGQSAQWSPVMMGLTRIAREFDAAVVALHHSRKSDGRARDSGDITAAADRVLEQLERPTDGKQAFTVRSRYEQEDFTVVLAGNTYSLDVAGDAPSGVRVLDYLRTHPGVGTTAIRRGVTGATGVIDAAVADLLRRGLIVDQGSGNHHRYRLAATTLDDEGLLRGSLGPSQGNLTFHQTRLNAVDQGGVRGESGCQSGAHLTPSQTHRVGEAGQSDELLLSADPPLEPDF